MWKTSPWALSTSWPTGQRLRVLLRLRRRRDEPVVPGALRRERHRSNRDKTPERGLPLHRRYDRQGHRVGPPAEGAHDRQALLHVLRPRRHPRPPPRAPEWSASTRVASTRGGTRCGKRPWPVRRSWVSSRPTPSSRPGPRRSAPGTTWPRPEACAGPPDGGLRRVHGAHRPPRGPAPRGPRATSGSSKTRWSTTSSGTTELAPRGRRTGRSTR